MSNQLDLSQFTTRQLINLLWEVKGTPQAQPLYQELSSRPPKFTLEPDDPDWEAKMSEHLRSNLVQPSGN
ncbi:MAG: hypothetical protein WCD18_13540 [Thermosynechococcaceae cyanobacterium]